MRIRHPLPGARLEAKLDARGRRPTAATVRAAYGATLAALSITVVALASTPADAIVEGELADQRDHPWQVALTDGRSAFCGGALVAADQVVTAAHCLEGETVDEIVIRVGAADLDSKDGLQRRGAEAIEYPDYDSTDVGDIAVLHLDQAVSLGPTVAPIALADDADLKQAREGTVAGWGALSEDDETEVRRLREAVVPLVDDRTCRLEMDADRELELCAGGTGTDTCWGDSGGPLTIRDADDEPRLAGIVSWGDSCGQKSPGVYADVAGLRDWLVEDAGVVVRERGRVELSFFGLARANRGG